MRLDELERNAFPLKRAMDELERNAIPIKRVMDELERNASPLKRAMDELDRNAPAFNRAMEQLERDAMPVDRLLEQLERSAPPINRLMEQLARGIANEAMKRVDQGEPDESAAQYVYEEITLAAKKRWVQRGLGAKAVKFIAQNAAYDILCELIQRILGL